MTDQVRQARPKRTAAQTGQLAPFPFRILPDLKEEIESSARENGRSMNAEINHRLKNSMLDPSPSLRDHYAGLAMQAFLSGHIAHHGHESHWPYEAMAAEAVEVADAMLKARSA
ncbi:Arc family DNA-binding protein [Variovorax sp. Varisp41]|uniref:Arc family DNA-binding protein n=1 Tax=Variovorax sp. Varisp41 TaxID=3243033 RepID=UPI0039B48C29